jgi:alpha-L-rhamnosidase
MVQVVNIKLDSNASGPYNGVIGTRTPVLSWEFEGSEKDWVQKSYELAITYDDGEVSQHGPIESNESAHINWPGKELNSKDVISVSVRVTGEDGSVSEWSEKQLFYTGIFNNEWSSLFIAERDQEVSKDRIAPETLFRSPIFKVDKPIKSAKIYSTALGVYELEVNGSRISEDYLAPGWTSYENRLLHQVYDVTDKLNDLNVIGARVASGWYSGFLGFDGGNTNIYGDKRAISLSLEIKYDDGSVQVIETDETWAASSGPITNAQLYNGETYDANLEVPQWSSPDNSTAWNPVESVERPQYIEPQDFGYPLIVDTLKPVEVITTKTGKKIADFGQNSVGVVKVNTLKAPKGHKIGLKHAEVLEDGELGTRPLREAEATDHYIFKGDTNGEEYVPRFTFHGFRYVQLENWPTEITKDSIELLVLSTKLDHIGTFESSNEKINRLHANVFHSTRGNFLSIPSDCPQRDERMGWLGDIAVFAPTALYLFDSYSFLRSWLHDLRLEQIANGGFPSVVVPDVIKAYDTPWNGTYAAIWQDASVIVPYRLYQATGNSDILKVQYESMKTWFDFIPKLQGKIRWDQVKIQLGDWLDPTAPPDNPLKAMTDSYLVADAFLYLIVDQLLETAKILKKEDDIKYFSEIKVQAKNDFHDEYVTKTGRLVSESQTAYTLAIEFGLLEPEQVEYAGKRLTSLVTSNGYKIGTGFAGTPFILDALTKSGHLDEAYGMLLQEQCPSWLYSVSMGATTTWERWDSMLPNGKINPGEMTSFNHYALGAVASWIHEKVGGILPVSAGYKTFKLKPLPGGGLTKVSASHRSPYGLIESKWTLDGEDFKYDVTIPLNTTAIVELPNGESKNVGSGKYSFSVKYAAK